MRLNSLKYLCANQFFSLKYYSVACVKIVILNKYSYFKNS